MDSVGSIQDLWSLPLRVTITLVFLYTQVSYAFVAGLVLLVIMIPLNSVVAKKIGTASQSLMGHKDDRLNLMSEIVSAIRSIKLMGWEHPLFARVQGHRESELHQLKVKKYLDAVYVYIWICTFQGKYWFVYLRV